MRRLPTHLPPQTHPNQLSLICRHVSLNQISAVQSLSLSYSDHLLVSVFSNLKHNPTACLNFFKLSQCNKIYKPDIKPYCHLVHILSKGKMYDDTKVYLNVLLGFCKNEYYGFLVWNELVSVFREFGFSETVFDMGLKGFAKNGLFKVAVKVFDEMCEWGRKPSLQSCNSLLCCLVKKREFRSVFSVFEQMGRMGIRADLYTCTIMVDAYCKDKRVSEGFVFLENMGERFGFEANVVTYHCLINGYVELGDLKGVEKVLDLMSLRGVEMNGVTYTLLIKSYCRFGEMDKAEKVLRAMRMGGLVDVDERAYGVLIDGYCRFGRIDDALRIVDEMVESGLKMSLVVCNLVINGYCKLGRVREAEEFMMNMCRWELKPDSYSYNTLVDGFCRIGLTREAFRICDRMMVDFIGPSIVTYNTLLKGFCREGAFDDALRLWRSMLRRKVSMNERSYDIMLNALFKMNKFESAMSLWKHVLARGFATKVVFRTMINGLNNMGKIEEAEEILAKMER